MGTVVFPDARMKFFLTANLNVRAERRYLELLKRGEQPDPARIRSQMALRDDRDRSRTEAPLVQAADAILVDTTELDVDGVLEALLEIIRTVSPPRAMT